MICPFHCVGICTDGAEPIVDKTTYTLAQIKVMAPFCTNRFFLKKTKTLISLKNVLDEVVNVTKSQPLNICLFKNSV